MTSQRAALLEAIADRRRRERDPGIFSSVERQILERQPATSVAHLSIEAQTDSASYRGLIVGETPRHVVQSLPGQRLVAHKKDSLDRRPRSGENVTIHYSKGQGSVQNTEARSRSRGQTR